MDLPILVDSNVYIGLMRRRVDPVAALFEHFDTVNLVTCGMVRLKVLRGIRDPKVQERIGEFMNLMQYVGADHRLWDEATRIAWECDRRGHPISETDAVIAAAEGFAPEVFTLIHSDRDVLDRLDPATVERAAETYAALIRRLDAAFD